MHYAKFEHRYLRCCACRLVQLPYGWLTNFLLSQWQKIKWRSSYINEPLVAHGWHASRESVSRLHISCNI